MVDADEGISREKRKKEKTEHTHTYAHGYKGPNAMFPTTSSGTQFALSPRQSAHCNKKPTGNHRQGVATLRAMDINSRVTTYEILKSPARGVDTELWSVKFAVKSGGLLKRIENAIRSDCHAFML